MRTPARIAVATAVLLVLQLGAWWCYRWVESSRGAPLGATLQSEPANGAAPGRELPLERSDGSTLTLRELEGRPVILHLWATWCEPCRTELPALLDFAQELPDAVFVLASVDEGWPTVQAFFEGSVPRTVVLDRGGTLRDAFAGQTLPETWFIDEHGQLRAGIRGSRDWRAPAIERAARDLIEPRRSTSAQGHATP